MGERGAGPGRVSRVRTVPLVAVVSALLVTGLVVGLVVGLGALPAGARKVADAGGPAAGAESTPGSAGPGTGSPAAADAAAPVGPGRDAQARRGPVRRVFPIRGEADYSRAHHDYPATDVFAGCGTRVVSPVDGRVLEVGRRDRWDPATDRGGERGGRFVSIRGDDGVRYYLSHFSAVERSLRPGVAVRAGRLVARVGHSGSARPTPCHVHVGLSPVCRGTGQWWIRRGVVSPYRFLRSWERGGNASPVRAVGAWRAGHECS